MRLVVCSETVTFKYNGKELETKKGLNWYDYGARLYDAILGRFISAAPLGEKDFLNGLYNYCANNPIMLIDPTGMLASPIYAPYGNLLGTDDEGLTGEAIIMDESNFEQGMSHDALMNMFESYMNLPNRPDYDGYLTLSEANEWYRNGNGQPLFIDSSKISLSPLTIEDLSINKSLTYNFLYPTHPNFKTGLIYGNIKITLLDKKGKVRIGNDKNLIDIYDFETHVGGNKFRNIATKIGAYVAGKGTSYKIWGYGYGKVSNRTNRSFGSRKWFY